MGSSSSPRRPSPSCSRSPRSRAAQTAPAQGGACPPGSWFCGRAPDDQPTPAGQARAARPAAPAGSRRRDPRRPPPRTPSPPARDRTRPRRAAARRRLPAAAPGDGRAAREAAAVRVHAAPRKPTLGRPGSGASTCTSRARRSAAATSTTPSMGGARRRPALQAHRYFGIETRPRFRRRPRLRRRPAARDGAHVQRACMFLNPRTARRSTSSRGFGWAWATARTIPNDPRRRRSTTTTPTSAARPASASSCASRACSPSTWTCAASSARAPTSSRRAQPEFTQPAGPDDEHVRRRPAHRRDDAVLLSSQRPRNESGRKAVTPR